MTTTFTPKFIRRLVLAGVLSWLGAGAARAGVLITPATGGTAVPADAAQNGAAPVFTALGDIALQEGAAGDFPIQNNKTLVLSAPGGWRFNPGVGGAAAIRVSGSGTSELVINSFSVTSSNITVTITATGAAQTNKLTITNVQAQALDGGALPSAGAVLRTSGNPGSALITGITNDSTSFGQLAQVLGARRLFTVLPGQTFTDGNGLSGSGISGSPTPQTAGILFDLAQLVAADREYNIDTAYSGTQTISYSGPGGAPAYTTSVDFSGGQSITPLDTVLTRAETTTITATDGTSPGVPSASLTITGGGFVKIQLLVPGEIPAPGTASGKSGTPTTQTSGLPFGVTVNAVDDLWNVVNTVTDIVGLTSTDPSATLPADAAFVSGTRNFSVTLRTLGSQTLTANDSADASKASNSSPSISVQKANSTTTLSSSANPSCSGQAVTFTAVVTGNPTGVGIPGGTVDFKDGATVIDTEPLDASGQATFSASSLSAGSHSMTAQYNGDGSFNGSTSAVLTQTVNVGPAVNTNPLSQTICIGNAVTFTASATGTPAPAVQWQSSTNAGSSFTNIPGATNGTYSFTAASGDNGKVYRARFTNSCGTVFSSPATLTASPKPTAVVSGTTAVCAGNSASIQAVLTGTGPWSVTWSDGAVSNNVSSSPLMRSVIPSTNTTYTVTSVSDANCTGTASGSATVTVNIAPAIITNPASKGVCVGGSISFSASASAVPAPTVQWQVSSDGGATFANVTGATNTTYTFTTSGSDDGKQYRAQFTNSCGGAASTSASLTVNPLPVCSILGADTLCAGSVNNVYSAPPSAVAYRWSLTGNAVFSGATNAQTVSVNAGGAGTFTLGLTLTNSSGCGSTCAKIITNLALPTATVSGGGSICPGSSTNIVANLTGTGPWTVVWSDGLIQSNVVTSPAMRAVSPGATATYSVTSVTDARCSNSGSGSATVTVNTPAAVTANPTNKAVCAGSSVSFTAGASGTPAPGVQWQVSPDGGSTFTNIVGATSSTYSFTASPADNGKRYRALFTNACGSALSGAATLTVNASPNAAITADAIVCANSTGNIASVPSAGAGATYSWSVGGGTITAGGGTSTITYTAGASGTINLSVTVVNAQGCSASASLGVALASQGKNLQGWKNKAPLQWQDSTFNNGDHQYSEGNSIPMRLELMQMCPASTWCVVLRFDFKDSNTGRHFYDFLSSADSSEPTVAGQDCNAFNCSSGPNLFPIPGDSSLAYQLPGNFKVYNGTITNVSTYSTVSGSTVQKQLTISGVTAAGGGAKDVLILFGGHLARENEWGFGNGASSFPGASAKVMYQFCGESSFGNLGVNPGGIIKQADLSVTKTAAPSPLCAGNTLTYSLFVANAGPNQASPVTLVDPLPAGTTLNSVSMSQGNYTGTSNLTFALGAINAGSNATIMIAVTVNTNTASALTNTASVSATAPADPYLANNTATVVTPVFPLTTASPLTSLAICRGSPALFSTTAAGGAPFTYRWSKNGTNLPGATNSSFSLPSVGTSDAGTYCVIVTGSCGSSTTSVTNCATLSLNADVTTTPLANSVKCPGETATFTTTPSGTGPFAFVWTRDGVVLSGATSNNLTLANVTAADAGLYCVSVTGACATTNSCATLIVRTNTSAAPLNEQTKCPGDSATFATAASGTGPFSYVWKKDGVVLAGETNSSISLSSLSAGSAGSYCVEVTGSCNSVTNCATLTMNVPTTADALVSQTNCEGSTVVFETLGHGTGPLTYQWSKDGAPLSGQTNASLTIQSISTADAGTYTVQVTGACNSASQSGSLTVNRSVVVAAAPVSLTNCPGTLATFSLTASGTGLGYQWFKDGVALANQTNSGLALSNVTAADAGTYSIVVSGVCGNAITNAATLTINQNVAIVSAPVSITNCPGTTAAFTTTEDGTGPFAYQWFKDGSALPGATNSTLTFTQVSATDAGNYTVVVSGVCGNSVSNSASLTVNQNVVVATPPSSLTNCPGTSATFSVGASGTGLLYQWYKGAGSLPGQTNASLTLPAVTAADAGSYGVVVSGVCGNSVSNSASLTVNQNVFVATPPSSLTNCAGTSATFGVGASGTGLSYQWYKGASALPGQTNASLTLPTVTAADAGSYSVVVSGVCGNSVSNSASLTVNQNVVVATPPHSLTNCPGTSATFSVGASGTGLLYQWYKGASALPGQTNASLTLPAVTATDAGSYGVVVSGVCGNSVSNSASLTVNQNVVVATAPHSLTNCPGTSATFSVGASGTGLIYQWYKGASPLLGQTNASLALPAVTAADAGSYGVVVSGVCGNSVSNSASLTVNRNVVVATPPHSLTNCPGTSATFNVGASGTGLLYQWYKGAIPLPGQTNASLTLPAVTAADAGGYSVVVSGVCGNSITSTVSLAVNVPATADPLLSQTNCPGANVTFSTLGHGTSPLSYQWLKDGAALSGQTTSSLTLVGITASSAGVYSVQVTGPCNTVTNFASLTVNIPTTADPIVSRTVCPGAALSLNAAAHGTGPFTWQWSKDGKLLPGGTSSSWVIDRATVLDAGNYVVLVAGACNAVTNTGTIIVNPPTTATPLVNQSVCFGGNATFNTTVTGTPPFKCIWKKNGITLPGQTNDCLTIMHLKAADAGLYSVEVSGLCDSVTNSATLAVVSDGLLSPALFANPNPLAINDFSAATPYPSTIEVSCVPAPLSAATVTLTNVSHTYAADLDILLVGPAGQAIMLMSDAGSYHAINQATLGFSDAASNALPQNATILSGVYKPTDYPPSDNMPEPAPLGPYQINLSAFNGTDANGSWSLYVVDDALTDTGSIAGWSLTLAWDAPAAPVRPQLSVPVCRTDGCRQTTLYGQLGKTYVIQTSTDLLTWTAMATNTLHGVTWDIVDATSTNCPQKFYRAICLP